MTIDIVFTPPTKETRGFARRNYQAAQLLSSITAMQNAKDDETRGLAALEFLNKMPEMVAFLAPYVVVKPDASEPAISAENWLWDEADESQFMNMLTAVMGGGRQEIPPEKKEPSGTS
jgi:hypothetical protein